MAELAYKKMGDYQIPDLMMDGEDGMEEMPLGKYGRMRQTFLCVVVKHFCNTLFEKSSVGSCFKWSSSVIIRMGTDMIVPYKYISA